MSEPDINITVQTESIIKQNTKITNNAKHPTVHIRVDPTVHIRVDPAVHIRVDPTVHIRVDPAVHIRVDPAVLIIRSVREA
jgi:hypothetical protein